MNDLADTIIRSRLALGGSAGSAGHRNEEAAEGGCGVIGLAASVPIRGRHLIVPCRQMRNRGNGKGGGIAAAGCFPDYPRHYAIHLGLLEGDSRAEIERAYIEPFFDLAQVQELPSMDDHRDAGLEIRPPRVVRYFARVKEDVLTRFAEEQGFMGGNGASAAALAAAEDEFVFQNSFRLNRQYYGDREDKKAFVLSHGRNMMILKAVGYAEDVARYYLLDDFKAHVWIGHQRYPTRGRVWHPGGAHPFSGLDEALVHNGDFANYYGVTEYLRQRNYFPLFMTDTEVSVYLFDLYNRVYGYPLEYLIEALGPTTERDFTKLPPEKRRVYGAVQRAHLHGSPDGPWFFIIARTDPKTGAAQLIGITDTSMLRPQVFALQEGEISVGVIASEKQAIDAFLQSLSKDDARVCPVADRYWNARGGSHSDGGAFVFTVGPFETDPAAGAAEEPVPFACADKFGRPVVTAPGQMHHESLVGLELPAVAAVAYAAAGEDQNGNGGNGNGGNGNGGSGDYGGHHASGDRSDEIDLAGCSFDDLDSFVRRQVSLAAEDPARRHEVIGRLTTLHDRRADTGRKKRSAVVHRLRIGLDEIFRGVPRIGGGVGGDVRIDWGSRAHLAAPDGGPTAGDGDPGSFGDPGSLGVPSAPTLFIDCTGFEPQGPDSAAEVVVAAYRLGWRRFIVFGCHGDRFLGCGLGADSHGVRLDVYGSSGDYLGSGLDGAEIHVHGDAQDQVGQILKSGKLVIHGMVGQTFLYGAKGGVAYVLGNAAGRPLINAVGNIRAIVNGTALDYACESFMAGAITGGGFLVLNGVALDERGALTPLPDRYPGSNFFSLASGGAGYINDPERTLSKGQLNGGEIVDFGAADWAVVEPYLAENERHFGIGVRQLLGGRSPAEVYRKVVPEGRKG